MNMFAPPLRLLITGIFALTQIGFAFSQIDLSENYSLKKGFLYFVNRSIDFGTIKEEDGIRSGTFVAYNIAKDPLVISDVVVGCGCTNVEYSKDTLFGGDSVVITVTYNPVNQKGKFEKAIFVYNNGMPYQVFLTIKGETVPREKTVLDKYSTNLGNLRVTSMYHDFGFLYEDQVDTFRIGMYNAGEQTIQIKGITGRPAYIILNSENLTIKPGQESSIEIVYDARQVNDLGEMIHYLNLVTDDYYVPEVPLNINAHILERFPKQTKRRIKRNPVVHFDEKEKTYGKALMGDTVKMTYTLINKGKNPLIIRKIQPSCGCTSSSADKMEIAAGDSAIITVNFATAGRSGEDSKVITIITNDPAHPISKLYLNGYIVENPNAL
ncbi:MAG: DUF1573 domain-containing protein [Bacteroidia bacterium]